MQGPYFLVNSLLAHDGPIRCLSIGPEENEILTGCQSDAPNLRRWRLSADLLSFEEIGSPLYHDHWVTAVTSRNAKNGIDMYPKVISRLPRCSILLGFTLFFRI